MYWAGNRLLGFHNLHFLDASSCTILNVLRPYQILIGLIINKDFSSYKHTNNQLSNHPNISWRFDTHHLQNIQILFTLYFNFRFKCKQCQHRYYYGQQYFKKVIIFEANFCVIKNVLCWHSLLNVYLHTIDVFKYLCTVFSLWNS